MTTTEKLRVLAWLKRRVALTPGRAEVISSRIRVIMWFVLVVLFVFLFSFAPSGGSAITVMGFAFFIAGTISGFLLAYASGLKHWNVIVPHVNLESVEHRLNDLKPNSSLE